MPLAKLTRAASKPVLLALSASCLLLLPAFVASAMAQDEEDLMHVYLNHARVLKLDRAVSKVIVGSAEVADALVADPKTIVLTGRKLGTTNLVILDSQDNAILDQRILVSTDEGRTLRVFRSTSRAILTCTPDCETHAD